MSKCLVADAEHPNAIEKCQQWCKESYKKDHCKKCDCVSCTFCAGPGPAGTMLPVPQHHKPAPTCGVPGKEAAACALWCKEGHASSHCDQCACSQCKFCNYAPEGSAASQPAPALPKSAAAPAPVVKHVAGPCTVDSTKKQTCAKWCNPAHSRDHCAKCDCQDCEFCYAPFTTSAGGAKAAPSLPTLPLPVKHNPPPPPPPKPLLSPKPAMHLHPPRVAPAHKVPKPPAPKQAKPPPMPPSPKKAATKIVELPVARAPTAAPVTQVPQVAPAPTPQPVTVPVGTLVILTPIVLLLCVTIGLTAWCAMRAGSRHKTKSGGRYRRQGQYEEDDAASEIEGEERPPVRVIRSSKQSGR